MAKIYNKIAVKKDSREYENREEKYWYSGVEYKDSSDVGMALDRGALERVIEDDCLLIYQNQVQYPYLTPKTNIILKLVLEKWKEKLVQKNIPITYKIAITSLTRDRQRQNELLAKEPKYTTTWSSHLSGNAFDISLGWYLDRIEAWESIEKSKEQKFNILVEHYNTLLEVLEDLSVDKVIGLEFEHDGRVAHVARNPYNKRAIGFQTSEAQ